MRTVVEVATTGAGEERVTLAGSTEPVTMGMHGALAEFYGVEGGAATASSTLDYLVAAVAACLTGTLARALAARGVGFERVTAQGTGVIEVRERVPTIERIEVAYRLLGTHPGHREKIERAHSVHARACPVSRSLAGAIEISTALEVL